jgi:hypothetical protein
VVINAKSLINNKTLKILLVLSILMLVQLILVVIASDSPLEQQIFGRTGRGLGLLTEFSFIIILLASALYARFDNLNLLINGLIFSAIITSIYSIMQANGYDIFAWYSRTNGIIGTLGNPNFQSALSAIALMPAISYFFKRGSKYKIFSILTSLILVYTIYICQSTQGYMLAILTSIPSLLIYFWYKNRNLFKITALLSFVSIIIALFGMLNFGPLSSYLYKYSVKSRGEFFRTGINTSQNNPLFGVGIDSFGDYSTIYKSYQDAMGVNEYTDSAHNYFLNYAANGGYPLSLIYIFIMLFALICFFRLQKKIAKFDIQISLLFSIWIGFQAQSLISPNTIPLQLIGTISNGTLIGLSVWNGIENQKKSFQFDFIKPICILFTVFSIVITFPYFNVDRMQLKSLETNDGLLGIKSALSYPESSLRYQRIGTKLLESNLGAQALEVGRAAVKFNPNSIAAWGLILANSTAPISERKFALEQLLRLDPYDKKIREIEDVFRQQFP